MNLLNLFEDDSRTPSPNYAEELAYQIFKAAPNLDTTGAADEVLDYAFDLAVNDLGRKRAHSLFAYDEDFDSDLVNAYLDLQMNKSAEDKKQVNEVDPRNFDSDEDYYAAQNAPAKRRSAPSDYPYSPEEDDAYFREIFRKKREAAKKAEQDKGQVNELDKKTLGSYVKKATNSMDTHAYHAYRHQDDSDYDKKEKRKQGINKAVDRLTKGQDVVEGRLNEYLVRAGMPVKDVLELNLFQDTSPDGQEGMANDPRWSRLMKRYQPIANMLAKKIMALGKNRRLSDAEAEAVEEVWYDGSDAYEDMEVEYLADYYDMQIATVEAIIAGELQDEMDEGQQWPDSSNSLAKRSAVATNLKGAPSKAGRSSGMTVATRVEPTITPTSVKRLGGDRPIPSFLQKGVAEGSTTGPTIKGNKIYYADHVVILDPAIYNSDPALYDEYVRDIASEDLDPQGDAKYHKYELDRINNDGSWTVRKLKPKGVAEGQEVDASVVIGKLYDVIDHAEDIIKNADYDRQVQYATILRDRAVKALNMIKQGGNSPEAALDAFAYMQSGQQGVAEADKKKEDNLEPQIKDVALQRAISRAKADFPTAGSGIEALSKDFMRSQDQDQKSFDQLRQAERKQDQMLGQIAKIDQEQEQEIKGLENQNSTLASRLQQLQNVNGELEKKLAAMSGRKAEKKSKTDIAITPAVAPTASEPELIKPATKKAAKTKSAAPKSSMKSTAAQLAAPKADPMAAMSQRIQQGDASILNPKQQALQFEPSDNVLEPIIPQQQQVNPKFAAARANATDADVRYGRELADRIKQQMADVGRASPDYPDAERLRAMKKPTVENNDQEAKYSDKYQDMVARVGQKAREQEKSKPVDIKDLARRLAAIEASRKD